MSSINRVLTIVCVLGIASVGGWWWQRLRSEPAARSTTRMSERDEVQNGGLATPAQTAYSGSSPLAWRVAALERALSEREDERTPQANEVAPEPPSPTQIQARYTARIQEHERETTDVAWADSTSSSLTADFERDDGASTFILQAVDCRSKSCAVQLEWPTREQALSEWQKALQRATAVPCGREIVIPEEAGKSGGPARATLLLDCSTWVANGSPMPEGGKLP